MKETNNKGFSLVELVIVIAIMAVLVVVIAPQYTRFVKQSRVSADIQTAADFATAINVAVATQTSTVLSDKSGATNGEQEIDFSNVLDVKAYPISKLTGDNTSWTVLGSNTKGITGIILEVDSKYYEVWPNSTVKEDDTKDCSTIALANGVEVLNP